MRGEWIDEALRIISEVGDAAVQYQLYNGAWIAALERGDGPTIDEHFIRGGEIAAQIRTPTSDSTLCTIRPGRRG